MKNIVLDDDDDDGISAPLEINGLFESPMNSINVVLTSHSLDKLIFIFSFLFWVYFYWFILSNN